MVPGYRFQGSIGSGGFGSVLAARREADGAAVAIKIASNRAGREQLRREEVALRAIGPPAVPALAGAGELSDGGAFLVMERVEGRPLAARLAESPGGLPASEAGRLAHALLGALAQVHAAGWAHGDVSPENVLLTAEGVRLLDLGLAVPLGPGAPARPTDGVVGTAEYLAPERCEGAAPDARSDVYGAAVVVFELLTGRPPFYGPDGEVRQAQVTRRPPRPSTLVEVAAGVEEVLLGALAKDPASRPADAGAFREALAVAWAEARAAGGPAAERPGRPTGAAEQRTVGVALLEGVSHAMEVRGAASRLGGRLAHVAGGRAALIFDPESTDHPARQALRGAQAVVSSGLARRALVDVATVAVQVRGRGEPRYLSAALMRPGSYPAASDPPGVLVTAAAAALLDEEPFVPIAGRPDRLRHGLREGEEHTAIHLDEQPFVGRSQILARLVEAAEGAVAGRQPALLVVTGEAGSGKSALARALAGRLARLPGNPRVLSVRAGDAAVGEAYGTLARILRAVLGFSEGPPRDGSSALRLALPGMEEAWPALALSLGWLDASAAELRGLADAPGALRSLAVRGCGEALRRASRGRPLCLLLDDAHQAEAAALDALEFATLAEEGCPIFACAVGRPSLESARPSLGERASRAEVARLQALDETEAADLCRALLHPVEHVPARAVERLVERSGGNPLLLVELVRGLKAEGLLQAQAGGRGAYLATERLEGTPDLPVIEWIAMRELAALPPEQAMHARMIALLADEVSVEEVAGVLAELDRGGGAGDLPLDAGAAARALLSGGLLVRHRGGRLGFRHLLLRDAVARSVPEGLRLAVHAAATRFARTAHIARDRQLAFLARHAQAAGDGATAAAAALDLAERLAARHAYVEAERLYGEALAAGSGGRLRALRGRGVMRYRLGRYGESVEDLEAARAEARRVGDGAGEVDCLLDEATSLDWSNEFARSALRVEEAWAAAGGAPEPALAARLALALGRSLWRASRWAEACAALEESERIARSLGDSGYETRVISCIILGAALPPLGRSREAEEALGRAEAMAREHGDVLHLAATLNNRRNLRVSRKDLAGAIADQEASIRLGRELGLSSVEYYGEYNIGELLYQVGRPREAAPHVERAAALEERHPEIAPVPLARLLAARLVLLEGDLPAARARLQAFREGAAAAPGASSPLGPSEAVLADMVELATRPGSAAEWDELVARASRDSVEQEPIEIAEQRALAAHRAGRGEEASRALISALSLAAFKPNLMAERLRRSLAVCSPGLRVPPESDVR